jgi:hypothetical protein
MSCGNIHVDDTNVTFTFIVMEDCLPTDISGATIKTLTFRKPSGSTITKTASFTTTGVDGSIYYASVAGDIDEAGIWRVQADVELGIGSYYRSEVQKFKVLTNV